MADATILHLLTGGLTLGTALAWAILAAEAAVSFVYFGRVS